MVQDLSLRGFWLQKWMSSVKAKECRVMLDYLLGLAREGKLTYEYVLFIYVFKFIIIIMIEDVSIANYLDLAIGYVEAAYFHM